MRYSMLLLGIAGALCAACNALPTPLRGGGSATGTTQGQSATINGATFAVVPASVSLSTGQTMQLATNALPTFQAQVDWTSLAPQVATVSPSGTVSAGTPGVAVVRARFTFDTTQTAFTTVTVTNATTPAPPTPPTTP